MTTPDYYHFHVYFDQDTRSTAETVIAAMADRYDVEVGSYHDRPVGPHPVGSCQVTVATSSLGEITDWLAKNRNGLTVFIHANTGDVMKDHTDHTMWMGEMMTLDLDLLRRLISAAQG